MFWKKPLLVKDLSLNTIKAVMGCYQHLNDTSEVTDVLHEIATEYNKRTDEKDEMAESINKVEAELKYKYELLERKLRMDLAKEESAMINSFNLKEEKKEEEIYKLKNKIANLQQDFDLIKKENAILEQKMDNQDELIAEISDLKALVAALTAENHEKDAKFNLLKEIYDNPRVQETKVFEPTIIEPRIIEPRMVPTVSCNKK